MIMIHDTHCVLWLWLSDSQRRSKNSKSMLFISLSRWNINSVFECTVCMYKLSYKIVRKQKKRVNDDNGNDDEFSNRSKNAIVHTLHGVPCGCGYDCIPLKM